MEKNEDHEEMSSEEQEDADSKKEVYLPGEPLKPDEHLVHDESSYILYHQAQTGLES